MDKTRAGFGILMLSYILLFSITPRTRSSARTIADSTHEIHGTTATIITFLMRNVLNGSTSTRPWPALTTAAAHLPFPKPLGLFPPAGGIPVPLPEPDPSTPSGSFGPVSLDGLSFPMIATLQELELGTVTPIDEDMLEITGSVQYASVSRVIGKGQGMYVASSNDGSSHMMAMVGYFSNSGFKDGLRFFGVQRKDVPESHIAVIGGAGRYDNANGYASVKAVSGNNMYLLFTVYLS
ncbi:hypothetical protein SAY87_002691 [Trapa incisa]|uniref:Dirigent protein n=1 Tax=Trapa incisa TaxID=236973 RepID=A0AAN7JX47_9MYRT|nr:hypothetical protein SAY87_002691 [Trapa incisa]